MPQALKIAILNCPGGRDWGPIYTSFLERHIGCTVYSFQYTVLDLNDISETNNFLENILYDGYVITGSSFSAYDNDDWILNLMDRIRYICKTNTFLVGLCFGHQIISRALGGTVARSERGWGLGPRSFELTVEGRAFLISLQALYRSLLLHPDAGNEVPCRPIDSTLLLYSSHQDQVITPPPDTLRCIGGDAHCPFAASFYIPIEDTIPGMDSVTASILTFQSHPEFSAALMADIITARRETGAYSRTCSVTGEERSKLCQEQSVEEVLAIVQMLKADAGEESHRMHSDAVGKCIVAFLCGSVLGSSKPYPLSVPSSRTALDIGHCRIDVLRISSCNAAVWPAKPDSLAYFEPSNEEEANILRNWCHSVTDGELLRVRGRDWVEEGDVRVLGAWAYGLALKQGRRFFLLWETEVESVLVDGINYRDQLHFECMDHTSMVWPVSAVESCDKRTTVILCHGFCEENGPHYALIQVLRHALTSCGYELVVPDFRPR